MRTENCHIAARLLERGRARRLLDVDRTLADRLLGVREDARHRLAGVELERRRPSRRRRRSTPRRHTRSRSAASRSRAVSVEVYAPGSRSSTTIWPPSPIDARSVTREREAAVCSVRARLLLDDDRAGLRLLPRVREGARHRLARRRGRLAPGELSSEHVADVRSHPSGVSSDDRVRARGKTVERLALAVGEAELRLTEAGSRTRSRRQTARSSSRR